MTITRSQRQRKIRIMVGNGQMKRDCWFTRNYKFRFAGGELGMLGASDLMILFFWSKTITVLLNPKFCVFLCQYFPRAREKFNKEKHLSLHTGSAL